MTDNQQNNQLINYLTLYNLQEEEKAVEAKAKSLGFDYVNLINATLDEKILKIIPPEYVKNYNLIAYKKEDKTLFVATTNPEDPNLQRAVKDLEAAIEMQINLAMASKSSIRYGQQIYELQVAKQIAPHPTPGELKLEKFATLSELKEKIKSLPTTEVVDAIIGGAISLGASDIHLKSEENALRVRYRIDGVLQDVVYLSKELEKQIISRVKFLARIKLDIAKKPQDGKFSVIFEGRKVDIRTASLPSIWGEQLFLRILDKEGRFISLETLGLQNEDYKIIQEYLQKPSGMILVCGPTGSGKTTTLYALLDKLNKPSLNIITLEDPVEYTIEGVCQTQIDEESGYDFYQGLKAILRSDPDILMIGEIRDNKTAETAIHAALTGHIVLSTFHTNNAAAALLHLSDLDIKPVLLISALKLIISQRLVRKVCQNCKEEYIPQDWEVDLIKKYFPQFKKENKLFIGKGCPLCNFTGYKGRIGIFEILNISPALKETFLKKTTEEEIKKIAKKEGFKTLQEDGILKVLAGITTLEEVMRVSEE